MRDELLYVLNNYKAAYNSHTGKAASNITLENRIKEVISKQLTIEISDIISDD